MIRLSIYDLNRQTCLLNEHSRLSDRRLTTGMFAFLCPFLTLYRIYFKMCLTMIFINPDLRYCC